MSAAPARLEPPKAAEAFGAPEFQAAIGASDAQMADLERFRVLLGEWNQRMNLVGPSAMTEFWLRHAYDSAQLLALAPKAKVWADLGAGAGLPGLVLAILLKGAPGTHVHLVESMAKRCRFLSTVVENLDLPATVHNARAEDLTLKIHVVAARACAPLSRLLSYAQPYLRKNVVALFLKGQDVEIELAEATRYWKFQAELRPSLSSDQGRIVELRRLARV
jgi:16S rRNA (guanine527-N7)-methyltransferase